MQLINTSKDNINIFVDASIEKLSDNKYISCSGAILMSMDYNEELSRKLPYFARILADSTNNIGELEAILLGLDLANTLKKPYTKTISIYSDSKVSVFGLREWILDWYNNSNQNDNNLTFMSKQGKVIANQDLIKKIINRISNMNSSVYLYQQKGHVNINDHNQLVEAYNYFCITNRFFIDYYSDYEEEIKLLSYNNNFIDKMTREFLTNKVCLDSLSLANNRLATNIITTNEFAKYCEKVLNIRKE